MAAGTFTLFSANKADLNLTDLAGATVKLALVTSAYTPNTAYNGHDTWSDVSSNELAAGNGYTTGGESLTTLAVTGVTGGFKLTSDAIAWTATGGAIPAWRTAVMYVSGTLWGKTDPLVGYFLGDATPADVPATAEGDTLTVDCPTAGWIVVS